MNKASPIAICWFRRDLRLNDNPALLSALRASENVLPVYIHPREEDGAASRWWLHHTLLGLQSSLEKIGSRLVIRKGKAEKELVSLIQETGAQSLHLNRLYEPDSMKEDERIANRLRREGMSTIQMHNASLLFEPWEVRNRAGNPFQVFTPFWRQCLEELSPIRPTPAPSGMGGMNTWPKSLRVEDLELLPKHDWAGGLKETWQPGERGALARLKKFASGPVREYAVRRDAPGGEGTSRLSPHLHFGEISPLQIAHAVRGQGKSADAFLRELGWREFAYHLIHHFPDTPTRPLRKQFEAFPWAKDSKSLRLWQKGLTGYPLVDAGMRELWKTGWMHNRARMAVASFLVKHLLIPWQSGAAWFWESLVDADLANNTLGWQWTAGCGADAAPYFRIFNPVLQGQRYDADGAYVTRWIPELAKLPKKWIHCPWMAPPLFLEEAGIRLGKTYPMPIVEHEAARDRALEAFDAMKG